MRPSDAADRLSLTRRKLLSAGAGTVTALAGLGALSGSAAAWDGLEADFRGCSEVWITVGENDLACQDEPGDPYPDKNCPLRVRVYTADGDEIDYETIHINEANATRIPGQFGDEPVFKYQVSGGTKIIGVMGLTPPGHPQCADLIANPNRCAQTPNTPSIYEAPDAADCDPDQEQAQTSPSRGRGGPGGRGQGRGP